MKLRIKFGQDVTKEVDWWQPLDAFPKFIKMLGIRWSWFMYQNAPGVDHELLFTEIPAYDPEYNAKMPSFEDMFELGFNKCSCGAGHSSFKWDHMKYCDLHVPWTKV